MDLNGTPADLLVLVGIFVDVFWFFEGRWGSKGVTSARDNALSFYAGDIAVFELFKVVIVDL